MKRKRDSKREHDTERHESGRELSSMETQLRMLDARSDAHEPPFDSGPFDQYRNPPPRDAA
jgi:hypothetical protein